MISEMVVALVFRQSHTLQGQGTSANGHRAPTMGQALF